MQYWIYLKGLTTLEDPLLYKFTGDKLTDHNWKGHMG